MIGFNSGFPAIWWICGEIFEYSIHRKLLSFGFRVCGLMVEEEKIGF